jgi:hypothetical protein
LRVECGEVSCPDPLGRGLRNRIVSPAVPGSDHHRTRATETADAGWLPKSSANRMHLFGEELRPRRDRQLTLFDDVSERAKAVSDLKKAVNDRHGRFVLRGAATLPLGLIYTDRANEYDICDVRGKVCS